MIVALRPLRRGDVQYRFVARYPLLRRVDGVQLLEKRLRLLSTRLCAPFLHKYVKKRKKRSLA